MNRVLSLILLIITGLISPNFSVYSQFGKNKVQYQAFSWKFIKSEHFDIYFHNNQKELADYTAVKAEEALKSIENTLNYQLATRVIYVVYNSQNQYQQTNVISQFMSESVGGVTELFKNRIAIPFQGNYSQFRHVIHHELVHAVLNDMFVGGSFQQAVSSGGFMMPTWLNEGFAEYESIGGMDTQTDMFMRDITISESLPPLERISGYLSYRAGQTFYWYIAEKYGKEKVGDFINRLQIQKNVASAFQSSFHMSFEDFSEKWQKDLKKYYWPDLELFNDPEDYAVKVTDRKKMGNFYNSAPAISPDGESMAFISEDGGVLGISIMKIDDQGSVRQLISSFRQQDFEDLNMLAPGISWDPQGKYLAISAKAGGEDAIFITNAITGDYKKLTFGLKSISSVHWSPDSSSLAFIATEGDKSDIYKYDFDSKSLTNLTDDIFSDMVPIWSKSSENIYFISDRGNHLTTPPPSFMMWDYDVNNSDVYKLNIASGKIERLTFNPEFKKTSIAISPDETKLLYVSDKNGIGNLYELNLADGKSMPITNSISGLLQISLARDGSKLLFSSQVDAGYDIFMIRYPFEVSLEIDELPLTKFRKGQMEKRQMIKDIVEESKIDTTAGGSKLIGYGDFDIDFSRQDVVQPNQDVAASTQDNTSDENYTDSSFVAEDYKTRFTLDYIFYAPTYNTFLGVQGLIQMQLSDILGDHQIQAQVNLYQSIRNSTFLLNYNYLPGIIDYSFFGYHFPAYFSTGQFGNSNINKLTTYRFTNFGGGVTASYPFDLFNRFELGITMMRLVKDNLDVPQETPLTRTLLVPEVKYVHDDVLYGRSAPVKGNRYNFSFKASPKLGNDGLGFGIATTDIRTYQPLSYYLNIALRFSGGLSIGPNPQKFFLGGTDNWIGAQYKGDSLPFNNPEDYAFLNFATPLRGWDFNQLTGTKYFLANAELRFPLFTALIAGPIPIMFQGVMGSFFFDMGGAWNDKFIAVVEQDGKKIPNNLLMSAGVGIRTFFLGIPWKLDIAWRNEYQSWSIPVYVISIGYDY